MKLDGMNPAPPVTRTFLSVSSVRRRRMCAGGTLLDLLVDRVQRPPLDLTLDPAQVLTDESEDESLDAEHEQDQRAAEQWAGEVRLGDPEHDAVDAERERGERAHDPECDADPLDRLRPEPGQDVQRQPSQAKGRVPRAPGAGGVLDVDLDHARAAREDDRLRELLPADRAEHRLD